MRVFGCLFYVGTNSKQEDKFDSRADRCIFIGYPQGQKGWKVYNLKTHQLYVSRDVIFYEHEMPYMTSKKNDALESARSIFHNVVVSQDESNTNCEENQDESQEVQNEGEIQVMQMEDHEEPRATTLEPRARQPLVYLRDYHCYAANINPHALNRIIQTLHVKSILSLIS